MFIFAFVASFVGVAIFFLLNQSQKNEPGITLGSGPMFDSIAPYYDKANQMMSLGYDQSWRQTLVEDLDLKVDDIVLDMSTGTGDVALWIAAKFITLGKNNGQPITGFDPSGKMLSIASTKIEEKKFTGLIKLIKGDAQEISLSSNYYDKVSMSFGIRNVPDRMKALKEIFRVMSPNGKVIIMEFSTPLSGFLTPITKFFLQYIMPTIGGLISGGHKSEYDHLKDSIINFPSPEGFKQMMIDSGFSDCISKNIFFDVVHLYIDIKKELSKIKSSSDSLK
mmetsp:Transcript_26194/g.25032  ORF Transcript_26194/g.25032 Transcript_26194/m.25032 type:complete len:279 (-) Transcript_26194:55-891(-)